MILVDSSVWIDHINTHPVEGQSPSVQARARDARQGRCIGRRIDGDHGRHFGGQWPGSASSL